MNSEGDGFVQVPVPPGHVIAVYGFLAKLAAAEGAGSGASEADPDTTAFKPWTVAELKHFIASGTKTSKTITAVMDTLVKVEPGTKVSTTVVSDLTGTSKDDLKGALSALTRSIKAHYPGHAWFFAWEWGPKLGSDFSAETHYWVEPAQADLWKEARGQ